MPVGRCVMRTAESVMLTCWPPAPLERYVSTRRSLSLISISIVVVDLGIDKHRGERGVPALGRIERRDAHEPMHAVLGLQVAVGVVAADHHRGALDARFFAGLVVDDLRRPALALGAAQVHAQQHLRPVLRFGAAGAGMDGHDGVALVVLAGELHGHLDGGDLRLELRHAASRCRRRRARLRAAVRAARRAPVFVEDCFAGGDALLYARALAADFLRGLGLVPETGRRHLALDLVERLACGSEVKDSSGRLQAVFKVGDLVRVSSFMARRVNDSCLS